jgi:hypothetical protein
MALKGRKIIAAVNPDTPSFFVTFNKSLDKFGNKTSVWVRFTTLSISVCNVHTAVDVVISYLNLNTVYRAVL